jgi:hypothetical protein
VCLDSETVRRGGECFAGRSCHRCGRAAVWLAHGWFYCPRHFPHGKGEVCRPLRSAGGCSGARGAPGPFRAPPVGVDAAAAQG